MIVAARACHVLGCKRADRPPQTEPHTTTPKPWAWGATLSGAPQGVVLSPLLSNIYLHRLDSFVEKVLIPHYTRGRSRTRNPAYLEVVNAIARARRRGPRAEVRSLRKQQRSIPRVDPNDPGFRRLRYVR